jgi:hypothetical protein
MRINDRSANRHGFALLAVLLIMAVISSFLAMLMYSSSQQAYTATRLTRKIKAQIMAEAGCEYGYAILSTDWDARHTPSSFDAPDHCVLTVETVGELAAIVTATGSCGSVTSVSAIGVQKRPEGGGVLDEESFRYAVLCGGTFDFGGNLSMAGSGAALFHSNGRMFARGTVLADVDLQSATQIRISNDVTIDGNVTAPAVRYRPSKVDLGGTVTRTAVAPVSIPDIDLTPYYNWALEHGEVYQGLNISSSDTLIPNGGIIWVEGDVHISSDAKIFASIIATGDIHITSRMYMVPTFSPPANPEGLFFISPTRDSFSLASRDGDIRISSFCTLWGGLIYAKTGDLKITAQTSIRGQVIVNGDIAVTGGSDVLDAFAAVMPALPNETICLDHIAISAWQK